MFLWVLRHFFLLLPNYSQYILFSASRSLTINSHNFVQNLFCQPHQPKEYAKKQDKKVSKKLKLSSSPLYKSPRDVLRQWIVSLNYTDPAVVVGWSIIMTEMIQCMSSDSYFLHLPVLECNNQETFLFGIQRGRRQEGILEKEENRTDFYHMSRVCLSASLSVPFPASTFASFYGEAPLSVYQSGCSAAGYPFVS